MSRHKNDPPRPRSTWFVEEYGEVIVINRPTNLPGWIMVWVSDGGFYMAIGARYLQPVR